MHLQINPTQKTYFLGQEVSYYIGKNGIIDSYLKQEGDGCTPTGLLLPVAVFYRAGRIIPPRTFLPTFPIHLYDGWSDCVQDKHRYNQYVHHPYGFSAEHLWKEESIYDLVLVTDYNYPDAQTGAGSAIFIHLKSKIRNYTEGCLAFDPPILKRILRQLQPGQGFLVSL